MRYWYMSAGRKREMSSVLKTLRLDYYVIKSSNKLFIGIAYLIALLIGSFTQYAYLMVLIVMLISAVSSGMFFSVYEKNNLSRLYGILPVGRTKIVAGRYLYALAFCIANEIAAGILMYLFGFILKNDMTSLEFSASLSAGFLFYCFFIGILYPIYIRFGFTKVYVIANLPFYLIFIGSLILSKKAGTLTALENIIQYFTNNPAMVWVIGVGGGLVLICLSFILARALFRKTEM